MANGETREILQRLEALQRDVTELLSLTKQGETSSSGPNDAASEEEFFDSEGGE